MIVSLGTFNKQKTKIAPELVSVQDYHKTNETGDDTHKGKVIL